MARKKEEKEVEKEEAASEEVDPVKLSKLLVRSFNKDEAKTGKVAWSLDTDMDNPTEVKEFISTGNTLLNYAISNRADGGIPVNKITEIVGEEATGKSLLVLHLIANVQKMGGIAALLDTENALNIEFAQRMGVNMKKLVYLQPGTVEECGEAIERMILMTRQKAPNQLVLIAWDSTAGTPTKAEIEGDYEINMNVQMEKPKAMAKMMRKITKVIGKERIALVFTNQLKIKPGVMYGEPTFAPGGKAVPYHASVRIQLKRRGMEKDEEGTSAAVSVKGVNTAAKVIKNRLTWPYRKANFFISFEHGIEDEPSWFELLHENGVIEKGDGYCTIKEFQPVLRDHYLAVKDVAEKLLESEPDPDKKKQIKSDIKEATELARKSVGEGKDSKDNKHGWRFRESDWPEVLDSTPKMREWIKAKLDEMLVIKVGEKTNVEQGVDEENMLEVDQLVDDVTEE